MIFTCRRHFHWSEGMYNSISSIRSLSAAMIEPIRWLRTDSASHFTVAESPTTGHAWLHSLRGNVITHISTQTRYLIPQRSVLQIPRVRVGKLREHTHTWHTHERQSAFERRGDFLMQLLLQYCAVVDNERVLLYTGQMPECNTHTSEICHSPNYQFIILTGHLLPLKPEEFLYQI